MVLDRRGWYHAYYHLQSIDANVRLGEVVKMGQAIGILGKEGHSGGWSHLHYGITSRQPSGRWGTEEGYAFLWQADFGDGSQPNALASDGCVDPMAKAGYAVTTHRLAKPGHYVVTARRTNEHGMEAVMRACVIVEP